MSVIKEFKEFVHRGNVVDLAVGVIIGAAFGKIVGSLVSDIIMPPIGLALSGMDLKNYKWVLRPAANETAEVAVTYGAFIQAVLDFIIIVLVIFWVVKAVNKLKKKQVEAQVAPKEPSAEAALLAEIRDLLKAQSVK